MVWGKGGGAARAPLAWVEEDCVDFVIMLEPAGVGTEVSFAGLRIR